MDRIKILILCLIAIVVVPLAMPAKTYAKNELPECTCKEPKELLLLGGNCVKDKNAASEKVLFCEEVENSATGETDNGMMFVVKMAVNILLVGVGIIGIIGIIWCGVLVVTARDNEAQVTQTKKRLIDVTIGIIALWLSIAIVDLLLPGGKEHEDILPDPEKESETSYIINIVGKKLMG